MGKIEIVKGDLLDQDVDVIVNAWNRNIIPWWLTYANAGHEFPFLQIGRETPVRLNVGDLILGVEEDTQYNEDTIQLGDAARLVIVSDGVTEAFDPSQEQYGTERIEQLMNTVRRRRSRHRVDRRLIEVTDVRDRKTPDHSIRQPTYRACRLRLHGRTCSCVSGNSFRRLMRDAAKLKWVRL